MQLQKLLFYFYFYFFFCDNGSDYFYFFPQKLTDTGKWRNVESTIPIPRTRNLQICDGVNLPSNSDKLHKYIPSLLHGSFRQFGVSLHPREKSAVPQRASDDDSPFLRRVCLLHLGGFSVLGKLGTFDWRPHHALDIRLSVLHVDFNQEAANTWRDVVDQRGSRLLGRDFVRGASCCSIVELGGQRPQGQFFQALVTYIVLVHQLTKLVGNITSSICIQRVEFV